MRLFCEVKIVDEIIERLRAFGYPADEAKDGIVISLIANSVDEYIKNYCNTDKVPDGLRYERIRVICGRFLKQLKASGQLSGFELEAAVTAIKEGDTQVNFNAGTSPEQQFDDYITQASSFDNSALVKFRKLVW